MSTRSSAEKWAEEQFGSASLGDSRRTARLVQVAARVAENPSGRLSEVFASERERDAAYDFIERDQTKVEQLEQTVGRTTALGCVGGGRIRIAIDGSSANIVDSTGRKGMGRIGTYASGASGLKVISALAVDAQGTTVGLLAQSWWARSRAPSRTSREKKNERRRKRPEQKEILYWLQTIALSAARLEQVGVHGWFQLDREADAWPALLALSQSGHWFTVRSAWDRVIEETGRDRQHLRARVAASPVIGSYELEVPGNGARGARRACMVMHAAKVTLSLRDLRRNKRSELRVHAVWVHEQGTAPIGEKPLDWMLLTNAPIDSVEAARAVVHGYATRWRIEEFHKTWKSGACNVEDTQLRSRNAIIRWATILAVVAARIERLKRLARAEPERLANDELTPVEIEVLLALKRRYKKRTENIPDAIPTLGQAVRWIADIGGYTGKSSGGPPGSITIQRGLQRLKSGVEAVLAMREAGG
jgi:Transposase DNA-binding/Transposase Tn5 dimerisation domain